jgi:hypothetical protein
MSDPANVALNQLVLWYDPTRLQSWPRLLVNVSADEVFSSMTDFTKRHISDRSLDEKHDAYIDLARGLPGLETTPRGFLLRGVGFFEKDDSGYHLSRTGSELAESYRRDSKSDDWIRLLARALVGGEPRLRVLIKQLSGEGTCLAFHGGAWFQGAVESVQFIAPGECPVFLFRDKPGDQALRDWLVSDSWWALGEWRNHPLLEDFSDARFVGQLKPDFTLDRIGLRIRPAFEVLAYLGVFRHMGSEAWLDKDTAVEVLGDVIAADFGWQRDGTSGALSPVQILASEVDRLRLDTGFVIASELREALHQRGFQNPDKAIADFIKDGLATIDAQDYGQERHGRGLYGDPAKQLIRLRIQSQSIP